MEFFVPPTLSNHLPSPELSAAILLIILIYLAILTVLTRRKRGRHASGFRRNPRPSGAIKLWTYDDYARPDPSDPTAQLDIVNRSDYEKVRILNREEAKLLPLLERALKDLGLGHRVMAQTSLGEVIRPKSTSPDTKIAMAVINSKRLDFAVIDRFGMLTCAVEYQGTGHHQNGAFLRDAVKREALRKAGVPTIEVLPNFRPEAVIQTLRDTLMPSTQTA